MAGVYVKSGKLMQHDFSDWLLVSCCYYVFLLPPSASVYSTTQSMSVKHSQSRVPHIPKRRTHWH
jgi:hypothetical protein